VPREEAAAAVAAESSTGTWTTVWTDLLTDLEHYKGRAYRIEDVPGDPSCFYAFIAYPIDLFEEGSVVNVLTSLAGNVFGFKAIRALRLEDVRFPARLRHHLRRPAARHRGRARHHEQIRRPAPGLHHQAQARLSAKNYGRAVYECLRGGLDFTKDDENVNSQPFMRWRPALRLRRRGGEKGEAETGERKGHYLNVTAPRRRRCTSVPTTPSRWPCRSSCTTSSPAAFARIRGLANWCRNNGVLLHVHRALHAVLDRDRHHGIHFACWRKCLRLPAATTCIRAPWWQARGRPRGDAGLDRPDAREIHSREPRAAAYFSTRTSVSCPACSRWPRAAFTSGTYRRWSPFSATIR